MAEDKENIQETPQKEKKTWKYPTDKQLVIETLLKDETYTMSEIAKATESHPSTIYRAKHKIAKISDSPKLHRIAKASIKSLAQGLPVGELREVKDSTVVAACNSILDRTEPKINRIESDNRHVSIEITADATAWADKVLDLIAPKQRTLTMEDK